MNQYYERIKEHVLFPKDKYQFYPECLDGNYEVFEGFLKDKKIVDIHFFAYELFCSGLPFYIWVPEEVQLKLLFQLFYYLDNIEEEYKLCINFLIDQKSNTKKYQFSYDSILTLKKNLLSYIDFAFFNKSYFINNMELEWKLESLCSNEELVFFSNRLFALLKDNDLNSFKKSNLIYYFQNYWKKYLD